MKCLIKTTLIAVFSLFMMGSMTAQDSGPAKTQFSLETDPATFAFGGYAFHLRVQPKNSKNFLVGVGAYAMDFPDIMVDLNSKNKGKGWDVRLNSGLGLFGEYHLKEVNKGWLLGLQISHQSYEIENENETGKASFSNMLGMSYFGYTFKPFGDKFYIKPWAGLGYTSQVSGNTLLGESTYDVAPLLMFATVHVGYTF